jgi:argininosuccinate synthase
LYDVSESSMDELGTFEPSETGGFIKVQAIRLKKYGQKKEELGEKM